MKASELIAELQRGLGEHGDWEVVHPETQCPANVVWWVMPSLSDREDYDAKPHVVITRDANLDLP